MVVLAIQRHESATGVPVLYHPEPSLPTLSLWVVAEHQLSEIFFMHQTCYLTDEENTTSEVLITVLKITGKIVSEALFIAKCSAHKSLL